MTLVLKMGALIEKIDYTMLIYSVCSMHNANSLIFALSVMEIQVCKEIAYFPGVTRH